MREHICDYGPCEKADTPVTVNYPGIPPWRVRFCTGEHAILWLLRRMSLGAVDRIKAELTHADR